MKCRTGRIGRILLLLAVLALVLPSTGCNGDVYVGVGVSGPWVGYPYGMGGYPYPHGGVYVGRPF